MKIVDFRSDTVTKPTPAMRQAMANADVGDDVFGEDPTVNRLEAIAAEIVGKEAALFVASGTMGNLVALLSHTRPGDEVFLETHSHIYNYEVGGLAAIAGLTPRLIEGHRGVLDPEDVDRAIRNSNIHYPIPRLLCIENTHNMAGGVVTSVQRMAELEAVARARGLSVHLDGARVFNAAVSLGVAVTEITQHVDSVMLCLSKGLAAPVGSVLAGSREFIDRARKFRKQVGGGMRQAGVLAAAGIIAVTEMTQRLAEDHKNARRLAEGLAERGIGIDLESVQTNIVVFDVSTVGMTAEEFVNAMKQEGILALPRSRSAIRMVTHYQITDEDIEYTLSAVHRTLKGKS